MQGVRADESGLAMWRPAILAMAQRHGVEIGGCGSGGRGVGSGRIEALVLHRTG